MNLLDQIIAAKRRRVQAAKAPAEMREMARLARVDTKLHRLANALLNETKINIIAEFKRRSPSKGNINLSADAASVARAYESAAAGADALLLIVAALDDQSLKKLRTITEDELGMDALIEVHTKDELNRAIDCGARIIGV